MTILTSKENSDAAILTELGQRLRARRIKLGLTQEEVARQAGLAIGTVRNLETGEAGSLPSFIALLRALNALDQIDSFLAPTTTLSPLLALKQQRKIRQRARSMRHG